MDNLSKYAAACTRVHGMRGRLLRDEDWQRFLQADSAASIINQLYYKNLVSTGSLTIREAEKELRGNTIKTTEKVMRFCRGNSRTALSYFIYYFDLMNLETVITQIHSMNTDQSLRPLLYDTGKFGLFALNDLFEITNFAMLEKLLHRSFFHSHFRQAVGLYRENEILADFLASLEFAFLDQWQQSLIQNNNYTSKSSPSTFEVFILIKSIISALRLKFIRKRKEYDVQRFIGVPLRQFPLKKLRAAMESDEMEKVFHDLSQTILPKNLLGKLNEQKYNDKLLDIRLKELVLETAWKNQLKAGFSAEFLISFQFIKMIETDNIITLLECKHNKLDVEYAKKYLVGVA